MLLHSLDHPKLQWPAQLLGRIAAAAPQAWTTSQFVAVLSSGRSCSAPHSQDKLQRCAPPWGRDHCPWPQPGNETSCCWVAPSPAKVPWARSRCTVQGPAGSQQQGSTYLLLHALLNQHWWPSTPRRCSAPCPGSRCGNRCRKQ